MQINIQKIFYWHKTFELSKYVFSTTSIPKSFDERTDCRKMQKVEFQWNKEHKFMGHQPRWYLSNQAASQFRSSFSVSESNSNSARLQRLHSDTGTLFEEK